MALQSFSEHASAFAKALIADLDEASFVETSLTISFRFAELNLETWN
jgi:hypothetical protein